MTIKELTADIHQNAKDHGWWDEERSFGDIIALCHSELSEAIEEFRGDRPNLYFLTTAESLPPARLRGIFDPSSYFKNETDMSLWDGKDKLEGVATEMADCIIRILDWAGKEGIDIESIIEMKHQYNKTRPYRHGNKKL